MLERCQSLLQYCNIIANLQDWYATDHGSHTSLQDEDRRAYDGLVKGCRHKVNTETQGEARAQKQTVVSVDREHRDGCAQAE